MIKKLVLVMIILISLFIFFIFIINTNTQKGYKYIIEEGYVGKLEITYNIKNKPPFILEDGYQVAKFPSDGIIKTSSTPILGKSKDKYFFYTKGNVLIPVTNVKLGGGMSIEEKNSYKFQFWISSYDKTPNKYEETNSLH